MVMTTSSSQAIEHSKNGPGTSRTSGKEDAAIGFVATGKVIRAPLPLRPQKDKGGSFRLELDLPEGVEQSKENTPVSIILLLSPLDLDKSGAELTLGRRLTVRGQVVMAHRGEEETYSIVELRAETLQFL